MELGDSSADIEVFAGSDGGSLVEGGNGSDGVGTSHVSGGPFAEGGEDVSLLLLERCAFAAVGNGGVGRAVSTESGLLVSGEESPSSTAGLGVNVELSSVFVDSHGGSVNADDVSESVDDGEVFESGGENDEVGPVVFLAGAVERSIDNLEGADESVLGDLVREGSVNDDTIDVGSVGGGDGDVVEERVVVSAS